MVKKTLIQLYRIIFWSLGIGLALMVMIALAIQFIIFPNINQYKNAIADYISQAAKQKIVIGDIKVDWKKFDPHLTLSNITLFDAQNRPALQLNNTDVLISWLSIPMFELHLAELRIRQPELTIRRLKSGEVFVAGISMQSKSKPDLANWLLRQSKLKIKNAKVVWIDEMRSAPALSLNALNVEVLSPPWKSLIKHHRLSVSAMPSVGTNTPITLFSEFYGNDVSQLQDWHGSVTMHLKNARIPDFKTWLDYPIQIHSAEGNAEVYLTFSNLKIVLVKAQLALKQINLQLKPSAPAVLLTSLNGEIDWLNTPLKKSLSLKKVNLSQNNLTLNNINAEYSERLDSKPTIQNVNVQVSQLAVNNLQQMTHLLPMTATQRETLRALSPKGQLSDFTFNWQGSAHHTKNYALQTKFSALSVNAYEKIPGFNNLTGEIKANEKTGVLKLYTQKASLDFKTILRYPTPIDSLNGSLTWHIITHGAKQSVRMNTNQLLITNPHLTGTLRAKLLLDDKGGDIDLNGQFGRANLKFAPNYYPTILGENTLHWLDSSILSGTADDIKVILKGRLNDFPYVDNKHNLDLKKGLFRVTANVKDGVLEYGKDWPLIEGLSLKLLFEGDRMVLKANKGLQLGNQIKEATVSIPQLDTSEPTLHILAEVNGPVSEGILFVNKSPVANLTQGFTEHLKTSGNGQLNLNVKIPLNNVEAAQFKGIYQVTNGSLACEDLPEFTQVNGSLEFTENSLTANNINALYVGTPFTLNVNSGKDKSIKVNAKGKITQALLAQFLPNSQHYFTGASDFIADIAIQKPQVSFLLKSDLLGLTSYLPPPFNKSATDRLAINVEKKQALNAELININVGQLLAAKISNKIERGESQLENVNIRFSQGNSGFSENTLSNDASALNNAKGVYVRGDLEYLDLDAWRAVFKDLVPASKTNASIPVQKIAVKINTLDAFDRRFNQLTLTNKANKGGFIATIDSREIAGDIEWKNQNNGKLTARLAHLMIPESSPKRTFVNPLLPAMSKASTKLNQVYPGIDIIANQFDFKGKSMGGLELVADPQDSNWNIEKFKLINPDSTLSADGAWSNVNTNPMTRFNVAWDIQDLGKTLQRLGYPDTVKGGEGALKGQLNWVGSPHEFDVLALNGNLRFEMRQGQVLKVQPGVGRLLGLLTLQSLPRRLTLDFRDLFSNGFAFDKINARVNIDKGIMRSDNFSMTGPAADVNINGETNLKLETQKLTVKVVPHISDSLSLAALAGGPLVGAIAFLAQKVLKDPLNQIVSSQYDIIGTWDDPQEVKSAADIPENSPSSMIKPR